MFKDNLSKFILRLSKRGYLKKPEPCQKSILQQDSRLSYKRTERVNESYRLSQRTNRECGTVKKILILNWDVIQNQPLFNTMFRNLPIIAYKRGTSFKDMLVRAKL